MPRLLPGHSPSGLSSQHRGEHYGVHYYRILLRAVECRSFTFSKQKVKEIRVAGPQDTGWCCCTRGCRTGHHLRKAGLQRSSPQTVEEVDGVEWLHSVDAHRWTSCGLPCSLGRCRTPCTPPRSLLQKFGARKCQQDKHTHDCTWNWDTALCCPEGSARMPNSFERCLSASHLQGPCRHPHHKYKMSARHRTASFERGKACTR